MATFEQCKKSLQKRLRTRQDVLDLARKWGGGHVEDPKWKTEQEFIANNIRAFVENAYRKGQLDQFGMVLGFPSDAESGRKTTFWTNFRSWAAILISVLAIAVSLWAAWVKENG